MTQHTLETINTVSGQYVVYLYSTDAALEVPGTTIVSLGTIIERLDATPGIVELENITIRIVENYDDYVQGFWTYAVGLADCDLRIDLDGTTLFWGSVVPNSTTFDEIYLSGTTHKRTGEITFVSQLYKLKDVTWANLFSNLYANDGSSALGGYAFDITVSVNGRIPLGTNPAVIQSANFIKLTGIFSSMLSVAYSQSFALTDITVANCDIDFRNLNQAGWYTLESVYVVTQYVLGGAALINSAYFYDGTSETLNLPDIYPTPYDFVLDFLKNFGLVARHTFSDARHRLTLGTRGQSSASAITFSDEPLDSVFSVETQAKPEGIRFIHQYDGMTYESYYIDGQNQTPQTYKRMPLTSSAITESGTEPNKFAGFDYDVNCPFMAGATGGYYDDVMASGSPIGYHQNLFLLDAERGADIEANYPGLVEGAMMHVDSVRYYNYDAGFDYDANDLMIGMVNYIKNRFTESRRVYERRYSGIQNVNIFSRTSINDGSGAVTFYATEVLKDLDNDETSIIWIQE